MLTVLSLAVTGANSFITALFLARFTVLSCLANGRKGLVNVIPVTFPLLLHLSRKVGLSLQAFKPFTLIVATSSSSASLQIEFPFTLSERQLWISQAVNGPCTFLWPSIHQLLLSLVSNQASSLKVKGCLCPGPSHFLLSALCLLIWSRKAWLLNAFSGYVTFTGYRKTLIVFPLDVLLHKAECGRMRPACRAAAMPKSAGMLCKYLPANTGFISWYIRPCSLT